MWSLLAEVTVRLLRQQLQGKGTDWSALNYITLKQIVTRPSLVSFYEHTSCVNDHIMFSQQWWECIRSCQLPLDHVCLSHEAERNLVQPCEISPLLPCSVLSWVRWSNRDCTFVADCFICWLWPMTLSTPLFFYFCCTFISGSLRL